MWFPVCNFLNKDFFYKNHPTALCIIFLELFNIFLNDILRASQCDTALNTVLEWFLWKKNHYWLYLCSSEPASQQVWLWSLLKSMGFAPPVQRLQSDVTTVPASNRDTVTLRICLDPQKSQAGCKYKCCMDSCLNGVESNQYHCSGKLNVDFEEEVFPKWNRTKLIFNLLSWFLILDWTSIQWFICI